MGCNFPTHGDPVLALFIRSFTMNQIAAYRYESNCSMNPLADIFGADSDEALLYGQLNAADVFMEEDFDPTPEALLALEAYRSEA